MALLISFTDALSELLSHTYATVEFGTIVEIGEGIAKHVFYAKIRDPKVQEPTPDGMPAGAPYIEHTGEGDTVAEAFKEAFDEFVALRQYRDDVYP